MGLEVQNKVFAGPQAGRAGTPTFRSLVNGDLPSSGVSAGTKSGITVNAQGIVTGMAALGNSDLPASGVSAGTYQGITVNAQGIVTGASNQSYLIGNQSISLGTDLSGSGTTSIYASIVAGAVTLAKMANMTALSVIGNVSAGAATPSTITFTNLKTQLSLVKGDVGLGNVENTALSTWAGTSYITTVGTLSALTVSGATVINNTFNIEGTRFTTSGDTATLYLGGVGSTLNYIQATYGANIVIHTAGMTTGVVFAQNNDWLGVGKVPTVALDVNGVGAFSGNVFDHRHDPFPWRIEL